MRMRAEQALTERKELAAMTEMQVYIGLNDSDTQKQMFHTGLYISVLKKVCYSFKVPFSFSVAEGGYFHENGDYVQEKTLVLTFYDVERETVDKLAGELCALFHQESVMVTESEASVRYISQTLNLEDIGRAGE